MVNNNKLIIAIILLIILSSFSIYNISKIKGYENDLNIIKKNLQYKEKLIKILNINMIRQYVSENSRIDNKLTLIDNKGERHLYSSIINEKMVVIRVVSSSCNACLEDLIKNIYSQLNKYDISQKIFIFSNVSNYREFLTFVKYHALPPESCYFIENHKLLNVHIEKFNPFIYMYIAENNKIIRNVFVPVISNPDLTNDYFSYINTLIN